MCTREGRGRPVAVLALLGLSVCMLGFTFQSDTPENQGMLPAGLDALQAYSDTFSSATGLIVMRNDLLVHERYNPGKTGVGATFDIKSATKSFGGGLLVKALDDGAVTLGDQGCSRPDVTVHHLASMTSGMKKNSSETCDRPFWFEPGEDFAYSDGSADILADKLRDFYGADLLPLMTSAIMDPIGVEDWSWPTQNFSAGLRISVRGMIRYGRLWLRGGDWDGVQVLSQAGVTLASSVSNPTLREDYGYLWWVRGNQQPPFYDRYGFQLNPVFPESAPPDAFLAAGCTRSWILVVPSLDLVAARAGGACIGMDTTQFTDEARGFVEHVLAAVSDCSDGEDNDADGLIDFPADPGCTSLAGPSEGRAAVPSVGPLGLFAIALSLVCSAVFISKSGRARAQ